MDISADNRTYHASRRPDHRRASHASRGRGIYSTGRDHSRGVRGLSGLEIAVIVALVAAVIAAAVLSGTHRGTTPLRTTTVKVGQGESLWSIASEHPVPGMTTEQSVEAIRQANHLSSSTIAAGSVLRVPGATQAAVALAR